MRRHEAAHGGGHRVPNVEQRAADVGSPNEYEDEEDLQTGEVSQANHLPDFVV